MGMTPRYIRFDVAMSPLPKRHSTCMILTMSNVISSVDGESEVEAQ